MAQYFEALVRKDARFEIIGKVDMGLVCFRVKVSPFKSKTVVALSRLS